MRSFLAALLLANTCWGVTQAKTIDHVLERLAQREASMKSVRFSFKQQIDFKEAGFSNEVQGQAVFAKPGKFQIKKEGTEKQTIISNGKRIWVHVPQNQQAWEGTVKGW